MQPKFRAWIGGKVQFSLGEYTLVDYKVEFDDDFGFSIYTLVLMDENGNEELVEWSKYGREIKEANSKEKDSR